MVSGFLLNGILSTNLDSPIVIEAFESGILPKGTRFFCAGRQEKSLIKVTCSLMILEKKEYPVSVQILNQEGQVGLKGEIYTGLAQEMAIDMGNNLLMELMDMLKKGPLPQSLKKATQKITREGQKNSSYRTIFIKAGAPLFIYFQRKFYE